MIARPILWVLCVIGLAAVLSGCATNPPHQTITTRTEWVVISPPQTMTVREPTPRPTFTPQEYSVAPWEKREEFLINLQERLFGALKIVNEKLLKIDEWTILQKQNVDKQKEVPK